MPRKGSGRADDYPCGRCGGIAGWPGSSNHHHTARPGRLVNVGVGRRCPAVPEALRLDCPPTDRLVLQFADLALADFGGDYTSSVGPWGRPAEWLVMHR